MSSLQLITDIQIRTSFHRSFVCVCVSFSYCHINMIIVITVIISAKIAASFD